MLTLLLMKLNISKILTVIFLHLVFNDVDAYFECMDENKYLRTKKHYKITENFGMKLKKKLEQ